MNRINVWGTPITEDKEMIPSVVYEFPEIVRKRIERLIPAKARQQSILGWLLLKRMLGPEWNALSKKISFSPYGKPFFSASEFSFNISHSGCFVVCALSADNLPLGIDTEKKKKANPHIVKKCYTFEEQAEMSGNEDPDHLFTTIWTRKESIGKLLGKGILFTLQEVKTTPCLARYKTKEFYLYSPFGEKDKSQVTTLAATTKSEINSKIIEL